MKTIAIHRSFNRVNTFMGGDRELVMISALIAVVIVMQGQSFLGFIIATVFWLIMLAVARQMNKVDPQMRHVFVADLKFRQRYFPPTSHVLANPKINYNSTFLANRYGYK